MKLIHDKLPALVALDFKAGTANRYVRRFDTSGAGLGLAGDPHSSGDV